MGYLGAHAPDFWAYWRSLADPAETRMAESFINLCWRLLVMFLIGSGGLLAIYWAYSGLLGALSGQWTSTATLPAGIALAEAVYLLCRHRNDLICS